MEHSLPPALWSLTPEFCAPTDVCPCTPSLCIACCTLHCAEVAVSVTGSRPWSRACWCQHVDVDPDPVIHSTATAGSMTLVVTCPMQVIDKRSATLQAQLLEKLEVLGCVQWDTHSLSSFPLSLPLSSYFLFSWQKFTTIYFSTKLSGPFHDFKSLRTTTAFPIATLSLDSDHQHLQHAPQACQGRDCQHQQDGILLLSSAAADDTSDAVALYLPVPPPTVLVFMLDCRPPCAYSTWSGMFLSFPKLITAAPPLPPLSLVQPSWKVHPTHCKLLYSSTVIW